MEHVTETGSASGAEHPDPARATSFLGTVAPGASMGIGSLPHRDARAAIEFSLREFEILTVPTLPRRSPAESMIAQALAGVAGVAGGPYASISVDRDGLDPEAPVVTDLAADAFLGVRTFLEAARARALAPAPVKWQFVGPVTLGVALTRAGAPVDLAFRVASRVVDEHVRALGEAVADALPGSPQLVVFDEPWLADLMSDDFPIAPDTAVDLLSTALATVGDRATVGVHCCAPTDWASVLAAGPQLVSLPATKDLRAVGGYLHEFLERGGWIAWGAIATDGPIGVTAGRAWHQLSGLWCDLVQAGADPVALRRQSLITPHCGLGTHSPQVAERISRMVRDVSRRVRDQATAARFVLGA
jgi:methionine synthase II (cobalamin-independent)